MRDRKSRAHVRILGDFRDGREVKDWMVERGEFELSVPII